MTPANLVGCWHPCCGLTGVHEHDTAPEACEDCASMQKRTGLRERAEQIADKRSSK